MLCNVSAVSTSCSVVITHLMCGCKPVQDTIEKERILNTIMTKSGQDHEQTEKERFEAISKLRSIPDWSVGQYLSNFYVLSLPVDSSVVASFTDRITELVAQVC